MYQWWNIYYKIIHDAIRHFYFLVTVQQMTMTAQYTTDIGFHILCTVQHITINPKTNRI